MIQSPVIKLTQELLGQLPNKRNVMLSPMSLKSAMKLLQQLSSGQTSGKYSLQPSNSPDLHQGSVFAVPQKYVVNWEELSKKFSQCIPFADANDAQTRIGEYIRNHTMGLIGGVHTQIQPDTLLLVGFCALDGTWVTPFKPENTYPTKFYGTENTSDISMMYGEFTTQCLLDKNGISAVLLPMENNIDFIGILPTMGNSPLDALQENLETISRGYLDWATPKVDVFLPRFEQKGQLDLLQMSQLKRDILAADLSRIHTQAALASATQFNLLEVQEKGVVVKSTTEFVFLATMARPEPKPQLRFDRPFAYLIRERSTGEIVLLGTVDDI